MKQEIKNRFTGEVIFSAEIDCAEDAPISLKLGLAVKLAVENKIALTGVALTGVDLTGAALTGANLTQANLTGAALTGANLTQANLTGVDLTGVDLTGVDLTGANLSWANLTGAALTQANLTGANLTGVNLLIFQGFGSRAGILYAYKTKSCVEIRTGCFFGTMEDFLETVKKIHGDNKHAKDYMLLCDLIKQKFEV